MASYSYKDLVYGIPDKYIKMVEDETGCEYDGDPGYDGDCWSATAYWVYALQARIAELEKALEPFAREAKRCASIQPDEFIPASVRLAIGDLRRAAELLEEPTND